MATFSRLYSPRNPTSPDVFDRTRLSMIAYCQYPQLVRKTKTYFSLLTLKTIHTANSHGRMLLSNHLRDKRYLGLIRSHHSDLMFRYTHRNLYLACFPDPKFRRVSSQVFSPIYKQPPLHSHYSYFPHLVTLTRHRLRYAHRIRIRQCRRIW